MLDQEIIELLNKKPYEVWKKIQGEELKISDYGFNIQALFVNLCVQYGLVPQVENHFKNNPDFLFKYTKLMGINLDLIFEKVRKSIKEKKINEVEDLKNFFTVLAHEVFHQVISFDFNEPLSVDDFKNEKFLKIILDGFEFSIKNPNRILEFSKEFEDYMKQEYETFFELFPAKLKVNYFSIFKRLIESSTLSTDLKKRIVSFMLSKQEFYGFDYVEAIEITPELLGFEEIYNNLQVKEIAKLLNDILNQSKTRLIPIIRYHKFLELFAPILTEAFENNLEENNRGFILKIITAINEDYIASVAGKRDKKKLINTLRRNSKFNEMFTSEFKKPNEIVSKILSGEPYEIRDRYTLATSPEFINNFDQILRLALNDEFVSRDLISAIAMALTNKLREEFGLEFEVKITNDSSDNEKKCGSYNDSKKIFYLNPTYIENGNKTLVQVINTIYHEIEHAKQYQQQLPGVKNKTTGIDFETYSMIIDEFLREVYMFGIYYLDNYARYSLEVAAMREARKETTGLVLKHNSDFKEICEKLYEQPPHQNKYIRFGMSKMIQYTLTKSFVDAVRGMFESDEYNKNNPEFAELEPEAIKVQKLFADYPFLKNIFHIDVEKHIIEPQPREKIEELLRKATNEADKELYRGILIDYEILASLKNPEIGITSDDVLPESAKRL